MSRQNKARCCPVLFDLRCLYPLPLKHEIKPLCKFVSAKNKRSDKLITLPFIVPVSLQPHVPQNHSEVSGASTIQLTV